MFGVNANPGVHFPWRHAYRYDYWDDDPNSARYNLWTDTRYFDAGVNPEPMHNVPVYNYAAVIAYNLARVPAAGSAISCTWAMANPPEDAFAYPKPTSSRSSAGSSQAAILRSPWASCNRVAAAPWNGYRPFR